MVITYDKRFRKNFQKRIVNNVGLHKKFDIRVKTFELDKTNSVLKDHALTGKLSGFRAFSITGDVRVIYHWESGNSVVFVDIGSHNQVYS